MDSFANAVDSAVFLSSHLWQGDALSLVLILAGAFAIAGGTGSNAEKEHLDDAFIGVDAAVGSGGVGEFECEMAACGRVR